MRKHLCVTPNPPAADEGSLGLYGASGMRVTIIWLEPKTVGYFTVRDSSPAKGRLGMTVTECLEKLAHRVNSEEISRLR